MLNRSDENLLKKDIEIFVDNDLKSMRFFFEILSCGNVFLRKCWSNIRFHIFNFFSEEKSGKWVRRYRYNTVEEVKTNEKSEDNSEAKESEDNYQRISNRKTKG